MSNFSKEQKVIYLQVKLKQINDDEEYWTFKFKESSDNLGRLEFEKQYLTEQLEILTKKD